MGTEFFWVSNETVFSSDKIPPFLRPYETEVDMHNNGTLNLFLNDTETDKNITNGTMDDSIPDYFTVMNERSKREVIIYSILFIIAAVGNLSVFISVMHQYKKTKSRIFLLILHLSIADLTVTFFAIPLEVIWRVAIMWYSTNFVCKICKFMHAFGLYLSSMVLICISVDRYIAIIHPLRITDASRRGRYMLLGAWIFAALSAVPQTVIYRVLQHPDYPFYQCVSYEFFANREEEILYNVFSVSILYFLPLLVIVYTYGRILWKISRKSRQYQESKKGNIQESEENSGRVLLRRNEATNHMETAKTRTLRLTVLIVIVFVFCWTPYVVMTLWWVIDLESAKRVDASIQGLLFIMAVANSCLNPVVYGTYTPECRQYFLQCCCHREPEQLPRSPHSLSQRGSCCRNSTRKCNVCIKASQFNSKCSPSPLLKRQYSQHLQPPHHGRHSPLSATMSLDSTTNVVEIGTEEHPGGLGLGLKPNYGRSVSHSVHFNVKNERTETTVTEKVCVESEYPAITKCYINVTDIAETKECSPGTEEHGAACPGKTDIIMQQDGRHTFSPNGFVITSITTTDEICSKSNENIKSDVVAKV